MEHGLVSVVIPVYNVERYLDRCLRSVVNQTYRNLEIILVNDGSPDNCPVLCEEWAQKDSRIKVIHKQNEGLGKARNTGIENATGEYICFVDSDDYIAVDTIQQTMELANAYHAEIVLFGFSSVDRDGRIRRSQIPHASKKIYSREEIREVILPELISHNPHTGYKSNLHMSACMCLISLSLISRTNWRFASEREIIAEDVYSLLQLYGYVQSVAILDKACYYYCENGASLTHSYRPDRYEKICYFHRKCMERAADMGYSNEIVERLDYPYISFTIAAMKMIVAADCNQKERKVALYKIVTDSYLQKILHRIELSKEPFARRLLFEAMKRQLCGVIYVLVRMKA